MSFVRLVKPTSSVETVQPSDRGHGFGDIPTSSLRIPRLSADVSRRQQLDSGIAHGPWLALLPAALHSLPETAGAAFHDVTRVGSSTCCRRNVSTFADSVGAVHSAHPCFPHIAGDGAHLAHLC